MTTAITRINPEMADHSADVLTARSDQSSILSAAPPPMFTLPNYEVLAMLGRGGMGVVYKARQLGLNRLVALKMILAGRMAADDELARFRREAEAVAALNHPNIVRVYDVGEHEGTPYFSLEYISGGTLAGLLAHRGPLPPKQAAQIAEAIARGAHEAHRHGIIHRDLKPANILLEQTEPETATDVQARSTTPISEVGTPKITDFGIAKRLNETQALTETGAAAGTPQYMAPEQALAEKNRPLTGLADVYSIGVILYEMLTLQRPFDGDNPIEIIQRVVSQSPPTPSRFNPKIPRDLETIILKCLAKNPYHRYATAADLADELARWLAGKPILARPVSRWEHGVRWCRRNPVVAGLLAGIFVVLTVGIVVSTSLAIRARDAATAAEKAAVAAGDEKVAAQIASNEAKENARLAAINEANANAARQAESQLRQDAIKQGTQRAKELYAADMNVAHTDWHAGRLHNSMGLLRKYRQKHPDDPPNAFEWHYLHRLCTAFDKLHQSHEPINGIVQLPDPDKVALLHPNGTATLFGLSPPTVLGLWTTPKSDYPLRTITYSSKGMIACTFHGPVLKLLHESHLGKVLHTIRLHQDVHQQANKVVFTADGKVMYVAIGCPSQRALPGSLVAYDVATGKELRRFDGIRMCVNDIALSHDGKYLVSGDHEGLVRVWDLLTGKQLREMNVGSPISVALSPKGEKIAVGTAGGEVQLLDFATLRVLKMMEGCFGVVSQVSFSADGLSLASRSYDNYVHVWRTTDGSLLRRCRGHTDIVTGFFFHAQTGSTVISVGEDGQLLRWDVAKALEAVANVDSLFKTSNLIRLKDPRRMLLADGLLGASPLDLTSNTVGQHIGVYNNESNSIYQTVSPDETRMAIATVDGLIYTRSLKDPVAKPVLVADRCHGTVRLAYSPDGKTIVAVATTGMMYFVPADGQGKPRSIYASDQPINAIEFIPKQPTMCLTAISSGMLAQWDITTASLVRIVARYESPVVALALSANGEQFVIGRRDGVILLGETTTGRTIRDFHGHTRQVNCVAFDPTEKRIVSGSNDMTARLWDVETTRTTLTLDAHQAHVLDAMFSSDGQKIVTLGTYGVKVWDASPSYEAECGRLLALGTHLSGAHATYENGYIRGTVQISNVTKNPLLVPRRKPNIRQLMLRINALPVQDQSSSLFVREPIFIPVQSLPVGSSYSLAFKTHTGGLPPGEYIVDFAHSYGEEPINEQGRTSCKLTLPAK